MGITIVLLKCGISAMIGAARKMLQLKELMGWEMAQQFACMPHYTVLRSSDQHPYKKLEINGIVIEEDTQMPSFWLHLSTMACAPHIQVCVHTHEINPFQRT